MIKYYNRHSKKFEIEKIAGDRSLNWIYSSQSGMFFLEKIVKKKIFSKVYGMYCDSIFSKSKINKFIKSFNINMKDFNEPTGGFSSFNDFFYRKLSKSSSHNIDSTESSLISPGDGKMKVFTHININSLVQVKGFTYTLKSLIKNTEIASNYEDGTCIILRLCPTDYHRFHFLDNGTCGPTTKIKGSYYSVNPIALKKINNLFCENKREWSVFHSENFSDVDRKS
ncbi:MAG: phosphatidylserine decarboxylase, partial [Clostridium sp.]|nr:phosphatidylserine decarboxylase [Clostridium sp.]